MKKLSLVLIVGILAFGLIACNSANKAGSEIKDLLTSAAKGLDDATKDMNNATDAKGVADALQKFTAWEKSFSEKAGKLDKKFEKTDLDKMSDKKTGEVGAASEAFANSYTNFANSLQAAVAKYGADDETVKAAITLATAADQDLTAVFASN